MCVENAGGWSGGSLGEASDEKVSKEKERDYLGGWGWVGGESSACKEAEGEQLKNEDHSSCQRSGEAGGGGRPRRIPPGVMAEAAANS